MNPKIPVPIKELSGQGVRRKDISPVDRKQIWDELKKKYGNTIWIHTTPSPGTFYSRIVSREIVVPEQSDNCPDDWDLFALLHEIGHVMTNTPKMKRCEQELIATVWALREARKYHISVSETIIAIYQNYIWRWRERGIKLKGKNMPSAAELDITDMNIYTMDIQEKPIGFMDLHVVCEDDLPFS